MADLTEWSCAVPDVEARPTVSTMVRISARVRPPGATLLGWATGVTNLTKFTFLP